MKGIIYSANIGTGKLAKYDYNEPHFQVEEGVLFSVTTGVARSRREARYLSRQAKIISPPQLIHNGWYLWMDSSMKLTRPIGARVDEWFKPNEKGHPQLIVVKHPWRTCVYAEIDECVRLKKVTEEEGETSRRILKQRDHPKDYGLWALGFIAFRHLMFDVRHSWWELCQYAMRDQFWLPCVAREREVNVKVLDMDIFSNNHYTYKLHGS